MWPGPLRRDHQHVDVGARLDQVEVHVEAVREHQRRALLHVGGEVIAIDVGLQLVRGEHHHHVGPFGGLGDLHHLELLGLGLLHAGRGLAQRDRDVLDAAIAQIERVRMALAAVADDGDLLALDQVQVGVAVVVNAHGLSTPTPWAPVAACFVVVLLGSLAGQDKPGGVSRPYIPSGPREIATTPVRDTSTRPSGSIRLTNWSILLARAGDLEDEALDRGVDHARAERVGEAQRLDAVVALAAHLDHRELALDRGHRTRSGPPRAAPAPAARADGGSARSPSGCRR